MSSALTVIVLGHAIFNLSPNTSQPQPNYTEEPRIPEISAIIQSLIKPTAEPTTPTLDREIRRPDYTYTEGVGAHKLITQEANWNTARRICEQDGSHLVIINSVAEAETVVQLLKSANLSSSHVGVHDLYQEGEFVTIFDEALARTGFNVWRAGEPNNNNPGNGGENCVAIFSHDPTLNDTPCGWQSSFVCEVPYVH